MSPVRTTRLLVDASTDLTASTSKHSRFSPPSFRPHLLIRGGHLQTIAAVRRKAAESLNPNRIQVEVSDGDSILLHDDCPSEWQPGNRSLLLLHGISGCHAAPYMLRLASAFTKRGVRVFRIDMRGCGAATGLTRNLTHAGRSDDVIKALSKIASETKSGPMMAAGVSLGGQQLLRAAGRMGAGLDPKPNWFDRLDRLAAIAPPIDLQRCADNMQRWFLRPYNRYFIKALLSRVPPHVAERDDFKRQLNLGRPKTLFELDDRITGPLSGFTGARDYYSQNAAKEVVSANPISTLVLAANDDPIVPVGCFLDNPNLFPKTTQLHVSKSGGHVGFIEPGRTSWMDRCLLEWFDPQSTGA